MFVKVNCKVFHNGEKVPTPIASFYTEDYKMGILVSGGVANTLKSIAKQISCIYEENRINVVVYAPDSYPEPDVDDEVFDDCVDILFTNCVETAAGITLVFDED